MHRIARATLLSLGLSLLPALGAAQQAAAAPEYLGGAPGLPFAEAVRAGDMLYLSGQIGVTPDATMQLVPGGIGPETRQTLENIRATLERYGSGMDRVVRCLVMLADIAEWGTMNEVYVQFFPAGRLPARSAMGASGLALGARVEIECTAVAGGA